MSSWDASSRPTWDPQGGTGENTQAFGVPDFPEEGGGFPSSTSPGTPPAIFLQDYDQNEVAQDDFGDFGRNHSERPGRPGPGDFGRGGFGGEEFGRDDHGPADFARGDFGQQDAARRGYGREQDPGQRGYGQRGPAQQDYTRQDNPWQDDQRQADQRPGDQRPGDQRPGDHRQGDQRQGAARDRGTGDYPVSDQPDPLGQRDADYAARMDPALRDFFAQPPARQDRAQQGAGQQRPGTRGYPGQGNGQGRPQGGQTNGQGRPQGGQTNGQGRPQGGQGNGLLPQQGLPIQQGLPPQPGLMPTNGYRQPNGLNQAPPDRWDTSAPRPGSRSARHHQEPRIATRGSRPTASIIIALVVVVGIAVAAFLILHHKPATPPAQSGSTSTPTQSAPAQNSPSPTTAGTGRSAATAGYTLKTPAIAGGYTKLASVPTAVQTASGTTASAIRDAIVRDAKGKVTGQVTAGYQLSGGQVLTFTGLRGAFSPAKVTASLASIGTDLRTAAAGAHGGKFSCMTAPGSAGVPDGTVCVWVTTTTVGITEFFGSQGPEVVTDQAKAAADALKVRDSVEVRKS